MSKYWIASEEGAQLYGAEIGSEVELKLTAEQERALLAAGWLDEKKSKEAKK
jgi:hypothetical protein